MTLVIIIHDFIFLMNCMLFLFRIFSHRFKERRRRDSFIHKSNATFITLYPFIRIHASLQTTHSSLQGTFTIPSDNSSHVTNSDGGEESILSYFQGKSFPLGGELLPDRVISLQRVRERGGNRK